MSNKRMTKEEELDFIKRHTPSEQEQKVIDRERMIWSITQKYTGKGNPIYE